MSRRLYASLICGALLYAAPNAAAAQDPTGAIHALDSAWARAYATHDTSLALQLFADDVVVTSVSGALKECGARRYSTSGRPADGVLPNERHFRSRL
jgi:hypothetical protein